MKRTIAAILSAAMLVTAAAAAEAPSSWAKSAVDTARNAGIVPEQVDQAYTQSITRADFCALAAAVYRTWEKSGNVKSVDKATVSFSDTEDEDVLLCASLGVVNGVGNGKFAPQQQLTRQQAASMLHRLGNLRKNAKDSVKDRMPHVFADGADIQAWARSDVYWAYNSGVMNVSAAIVLHRITAIHTSSPSRPCCGCMIPSMPRCRARPRLSILFVVDSDDGFNVQMHLEDAIDFIPYGTMVDEFQHIVYGNPELTPKERRDAWNKLEQEYRPYMDSTGCRFMEEGGYWQRQHHIFEMPFYYIDYVLAQLCAFQFKIRMEKDHDAAWADYMKLCRLSASDFYPSMLKQVGLTVPFTDGCIQKIVDELDKKLG